MSQTIILRFRDVVSHDTVTSHLKVIETAGYVWWGWWKKDSEPHQIKLLSQVRERARADTLAIGLFDRSTRRFFVALTLDCVFADGAIAVPEQGRSPEYYETEKVAAWFKFKYIKPISDSQFEKLFGPAPIGEETLFPATPGKSSAPAPSLHRTQLRSELVVHLSDIHLGTDYGFPSRRGPAETPLLDILNSDLEDKNVGLLVVSGDITTRADTDTLLSDGVKFLNDVCQRLKIDKDCVIIVPGNHDIVLKKYKPTDYSHEKSFHIFLKEFYGSSVSFPYVRNFVLPDRTPLDILAINSVRLRHESERQFGYVQWQLYEDILKRLQRDPEALAIAVLHHHLVSAPCEERLDPEYSEAAISTTVDAGSVIEGLQQYGFKLALHGHQNVPALTSISRGRMPETDRTINVDNALLVLAAGSAGTKRLTDYMRDNSYNTLRLSRARIGIESRRFTQSLRPTTHFQYSARIG